MLAYQRRAALLELLARAGSLTNSQAARQLGVSEVTIRNDLSLLQQQGSLERVHGGAVLAGGSAGVTAPAQPAARDQHVVAARAAAMVEDGESIVIAAGCLDLQLANALMMHRHISVITNSLVVAHMLAAETSNTVIIVGGVVTSGGAVHIDAVTHQSLARLRATRAFVSSSTLSATEGLLEESLDRAGTLRTLIGLAPSLVVLLDGDGGSGRGLVSVVPPHEIDRAIVREHAPAALVDALCLSGVKVSLCGATVITVPPRSSGQTTYKVAFANLSETELFTAEVRRSIERAARAAGNIKLLLADNRLDGDTALRNVEHFIAQGADLVIEYQLHEGYAYRLMHRLRLARIPVIAIDIPHPGAVYFGVDNYVAGRMAGEAIARAVTERWNGGLDRLFCLALPQSGQVVAARLQGQIDAIRESIPVPPEKIVWIDSGNTYQTAYHQLRAAITGLDALERRLVVSGVNDETTLGAIAALEESGHAAQAIAVSQGADRLALTELRRPCTPLIGAVAFRPETYGERVIALAQDMLSGKAVPPAVYQHLQLIRPSEAQSYLDALGAYEAEAGPRCFSVSSESALRAWEVRSTA